MIEMILVNNNFDMKIYYIVKKNLDILYLNLM